MGQSLDRLQDEGQEKQARFVTCAACRRRSECRGKVFDFDKSSFTRVILPDASARAEKKRRMFERL
jgi:hypothetical protein